MTNQEIRELIKRMVDAIEDNKKLQQIFNYIHRIYIRRAGK